MTTATPAPGTAPGLSVPVETLPSLLQLDRLEFAAHDADNIRILANTALNYLDNTTPKAVGALLSMIMDHAQILAWNLNRMDAAQRTAK